MMVYALKYLIGGKPYLITVRAGSLEKAKKNIDERIKVPGKKEFLNEMGSLNDQGQEFIIGFGPFDPFTLLS